ncbi:BACON domain-containing carbohydrate-binding protein [uncultured Alistipes sp.]|uniref:leucine-rich repeat domain-containing protein n=1 Tax=uncultured Alistipes sp. TaxID=538949 RepID=UPI0026019EE5|nr:BACON domain-containing carbohydrate-binding protein [uncultured Alistipes sp.]
MKTPKPLYWLALTAALALAFTGCKKDDDASRSGNLTIEKTEYTLDADEERTATVAFTATADWTLSVAYDDAESSADWLTVTPTSGTAGEQTVELSATRNFRASARTAYADIACGKQSVRLTVTQAAASDATDFTAQFDPDFAKELQKQDIIADAEHITPEDMEKIAAITELDVSGTEDAPGALTSLQGIEYFESLTFLKCDSNQLTTLDVSANTALTFLKCNSNQLTSLDVSANTALTYLYCHSNQLTKLDVSANTALTYLSCSSNSLTKLDVRQHTELMNLSCSSNSLTSLDVSRNTALTDLWCESNQLTELNVSANTALTQLVCNANQLTELDVRQNTALTGLWCYDNQLTKLDVSANTALTWLSCENNPGDGVSTFPVTAWFDNETVPAGLNVHSSSWRYDGKTITIDFRKAE